ncbi:hypothetical protein F5Y06DRAFT_305983 [Hypoxylon sp. FL0890]|nr:hypothetical protein F5Y06DRAFT_305983 [Hypoxylon sp. FL0890]
MKTDYYLNLCLEQAELSPLHHRHGCVVVKGGKVIGKGFNDYRPGYDGGGTLKTGRLPTKSFVAHKQKQHATMKEEKHGPKDGFKPFENIVGLLAAGHHHANNSLTMHSEMMAINSALESSSTSAAMTLSRFKPSSSPSRDSKRKRQLRRNVVGEYARRVCYDTFGLQVQQGAGQAQIAEWRFEPCTYQWNATTSRIAPQTSYEKTYSATEKLQQRKQRGKQRAHNNDNKGHKGPKIAPSGQQSIAELNGRSGYGSSAGFLLQDGIGYDGPHRIPKVDHIKAKEWPNNNVPETVLFSNNQRDRMKHPKLRGADVYVARLGSTQSLGRHKEGAKKARREAKQYADMRDGCLPTVRAPTGSLHDELLCKEPKPALREAHTHESLKSSIDHANILDSRPCYRCVLYMHSAGIRRVHWTSKGGQWESAKVRDLFDQVSGTNICDGQNVNSSSLGGVFVTKHEVLMLRRLSGHSSSS